MIHYFRRLLFFPFRITILVFIFEILIFIFLSTRYDYIIYNNEVFIALIFTLIPSFSLAIEVVRYAGYNTKDIIDGLKRLSKSKLEKYELIIGLFRLIIALSVAIVILSLSLPDFIYNCILFSIYLFILSLYRQKDYKSYIFQSTRPLKATMIRISFLFYLLTLIVLLTLYWYPLCHLITASAFPVAFFCSNVPIIYCRKCTNSIYCQDSYSDSIPKK
jgi:hypothetical protein